MLIADFVNDLRRNYMTLPYEESEDCFSLRMLTENKTDEFLPLEIRRLNGEKYLYYDISGKQSMEVMYAEKVIDREAFQAIMWNLHETLAQGRELFLPESGICLEPSMLFWDLEKQRWQYAYLPDRDGKDAEAVQGEKERLAEFLAMRMDYDDRSLTEAVYRFYEEMCAGRMRPESFLGREKTVDGGETEASKEERKETKGAWGIIGEEKKAENSWGAERKGEKAGNEWRADRDEKEAEYEWRVDGERKKAEIEDEWEQGGKGEKIKGRTKVIFLFLLLTAVSLTFIMSRYDSSVIVPGGMVCIALAGLLLRVLIKQQKEQEEDADGEIPEAAKSAETYKEAYKEFEASGEFALSEFASSEKPLKGILEKTSDDIYDEMYDGRTVYVDIQKEQERKLYGVGKFRKQKISLERLPCTIGKDKTMADFVISDSSVSRMHTRFFAEGELLWMQDLNSTNGTYHNGLRLKPNEKVLLEPEDEVGIGRAQFVYR